MTGKHHEAVESAATGVFGAALRRHRQRLLLSQEDLAEVSGVAARTISDLERGVAKRPRPATVRLLANGLGLAGDDLTAFNAAARAWRGADIVRASSESTEIDRLVAVLETLSAAEATALARALVTRRTASPARPPLP